jgi:hypothetical protein
MKSQRILKEVQIIYREKPIHLEGKKPLTFSSHILNDSSESTCF